MKDTICGGLSSKSGDVEGVVDGYHPHLLINRHFDLTHRTPQGAIYLSLWDRPARRIHILERIIPAWAILAKPTAEKEVRVCGSLVTLIYSTPPNFFWGTFVFL